jgi:hypothetical protein
MHQLTVTDARCEVAGNHHHQTGGQGFLGKSKQLSEAVGDEKGG